MDMSGFKQVYYVENDSAIAIHIVEKIFQHINDCIQNDKSQVKLNMLEKGIIKGMLSSGTLKGINNYVQNMYQNDVKNLMNDIEAEVKKRGH